MVKGRESDFLYGKGGGWLVWENLSLTRCYAKGWD